MGLPLHKITSIKLTNNSNVVEDFHSDVQVAVGDILYIMGVDYQIASIPSDHKLILFKPYVASGELVAAEMKIKILPGYIKSQVKMTGVGVLTLITIQDMDLPNTKNMGIMTPGWWYINKYESGTNIKYRNELLIAISINDEILPKSSVTSSSIIENIVVSPIEEIKLTKPEPKISPKK